MLTLSVAVVLVLLAGDLLFVRECIHEGQGRATRVAMAGGAGCVGVLLVLWAWPAARAVVVIGAVGGAAVVVWALRGGVGNARALAGAAGYLEGDGFERWDERDIVFARNRSLRPGSPQYDAYYGELHPERKEADDARRAVGGPLGRLGSIDGWAPNTAMVQAMVQVPALLAAQADLPAAEGVAPAALAPERATETLKGFAEHLGAVAVGVCRVDPRWAYSNRGEIHRGNWDDWGEPIEADLPYAVVVATEMDWDMLRAGPHTPVVVESMARYAQGAHITTIMARWFSALGYRGLANHSRFYTHNLVPLAIDAGLGEMGRFGYLISDKVGPRCRLFACLTDMPLVPDRPVDLGVETFCEGCQKCAESCPSRSIPKGPKEVDHGLRRWKINAETCFGYWGKVGTDCSVCMGVCPYSRPNRSVHKLMRSALKRYPAVRKLAPPIDNVLYGRRWKPASAPGWVQPPGRSERKTEPL